MAYMSTDRVTSVMDWDKGRNNEKFFGPAFREFRAVYSVQFVSLYLLLTSALFLSLCVYHFFCISDSYQSTLRYNPEEQIHQLRSRGSRRIKRYPIPSKNHRNTCWNCYRIPAPRVLPTVLHFNIWDSPKLIAELGSFLLKYSLLNESPIGVRQIFMI